MAVQGGLSSEEFKLAVEKARLKALKMTQGKHSLDDGEPEPETKRFASLPLEAEPDKERTFDMPLPGTKVGYVIGKGGEMIRQLQERANVKMTVIQTTAEVTNEQKSLRIIGEPSRVDYAIQLVNDLLAEKEMEAMKMKQKQNFNGPNEYGTRSGANIDIPVPPQFIGLVIGKGGETIKRIQQETGAKVQFDTTKSDAKGNKVCSIHGNPDAVSRAADMVREVLDNATNSKKRNDGGGGNNHHHMGEEIRMTVPANRTGVVIGKGGDTIRAIKQQSGCDIELVKDSKGIFIIRGSPDRIQYAQQLINDKVHGPGGPGAGSAAMSSPSPSANSNYGEQQGYWSNYWQQGDSQPNTQEAPPGQDTNAAAWAAYYAQYYAQAQQPGMPGMASAAQPSEAQADLSHQNAAAAAASQQDYSAQWAEYYRAYGMHKEAEMIEQMAKNAKQPQAASYDSNGDQGDNSHGNPTPVAYPGYNYALYGAAPNSGGNENGSSDK